MCRIIVAIACLLSLSLRGEAQTATEVFQLRLASAELGQAILANNFIGTALTCNPLRLGRRREVFTLHRGQRAAQVAAWIAHCPPGRHGIAEHLPAIAQRPVRGFQCAPVFNPPHHGQVSEAVVRGSVVEGVANDANAGVLALPASPCCSMEGYVSKSSISRPNLCDYPHRLLPGWHV